MNIDYTGKQQNRVMKTRRGFIYITGSTAIAFLPACSKTRKVQLRIGYLPIADAAQIYVGIENGYFAEQGLSIALEQLASGANTLEAVSVGSLALGMSSYMPYSGWRKRFGAASH